jgi:hypothetical protein
MVGVKHQHCLAGSARGERDPYRICGTARRILNDNTNAFCPVNLSEVRFDLLIANYGYVDRL